MTEVDGAERLQEAALGTLVGNVWNVTGVLQRDRPGQRIALGLRFATHSKTVLRAGDIASLTYQGVDHRLVVETPSIYPATQQMNLVQEVKS